MPASQNHLMRILIIVLAIAFTVFNRAQAADVKEAIAAGFAAVRALQPMRSGATYSVKVRGVTESGPGDQFLRRREADEIVESKLSCGCGDNALVFLRAVEGRGLKTLYIDSAEVSSASLITCYSGHVVVALREPDPDESNGWTLVDTTNLRIISDHWSKAESSFIAFHNLFWIGYCGSWEEYPVHTPDELRRFYTDTLAKVPPSVLATALIRLKFTIDPSLVNPDGSLANPRVSKFIGMQEQVLKAHSIDPASTVSILLKRGGDDANSTLSFVESEGWVARIGKQGGCNPSLLEYFESYVRQKNERPSKVGLPASEAKNKRERLFIVDATQFTLMGKTFKSANDLETYLKEQVKENPRLGLFITTGGKERTGVTIMVLDTCRKAGVTDIKIDGAPEA